jgi:nitroreductase
MDFDSFEQLVKANRSCRRFDASHLIDRSTLEQLVNLARQTASAANMQPLKYIICTDIEKNNDIFSTLGWAIYLKNWNGPCASERPTGYIVVLGDTRVAKRFWCDHGIAAQTILLGARSMGLAGCMFASINIKQLKQVLNIGDHFEIKLVIALGKPVETVRIEEIDANGDIKYYRDDDQVHHVPKRRLKDILVRSW